jgi:CHASE2 domain-containing sensor protein
VLSGIRDDTVRIVPLYIRQLVANPDATPTLGQAEFQSISLWMASQGRYVGDTLNKGVELRIGNDAVPIDTSVRYVEGLQVEGYHYEYENLLVYYPNVFAYGPNDPFRKVSYADLADTNNKNIPSGFFKDKFVFIGAEIEMFDPIRRTPHGMWSPYKIHASALNTILRRSYIKRLPPMAGLLSIVIFTHLVLLLSMKVPPRSRTFLIATAGLCLLLFAAAYGLFKMAQYWFDSDYPILATAATGLLTYLRRP